MINEKPQSIWSQVDWLTIGLYIALMLFGWLSICGASYTFGDNDLLSLGTRSGMQIVWIGTSICLGFVILMMDSRFFDTFSFVIYGVLLLLLFATIFNPHDIKGSHSWLVIGPLRLQPAEFGKFATALALAKLMSTYGYNIQRWKDFAAACAVVFVPMLCIVGQRETGSALVYLTFFLMFYREGMPGSILFTGVAMVVYFVVGIKYEGIMLFDTPTSVGKFVVLLLVQIFVAGMVYNYVPYMILPLYTSMTKIDQSLLRRVRHSVRRYVGAARHVHSTVSLPALSRTAHASTTILLYPCVCRRFGGVLLLCRLCA